MRIEEQQELLELWYDAMRKQDRDEADNWKKRFDSRLDLFTGAEQKRFYQLLLFRYYLMCKDLRKAEEILKSTGPLAEDDHHVLNYYYYFFLGIYQYDRQEYMAAIESYLKAKLLVYETSQDETAEFFYKLAAAYHRSYQISLSIKFAEKALDLFRKSGNYRRIAGCENLLGVNNIDIKQYKEAERHLHHALISVEKTTNRYLKMMILHNFGYLCSRQNAPETALNLLTKAKKLIEPWENRMKVRNLYLLAKNYFRTNNRSKARMKLSFALAISEKSGFTDYYYHCILLQAKHEKPDDCHEIYRQAISYFYENERWDFVVEYCEDLADHYRGQQLHEKSSDYYHLAKQARNKMEQERAFSNNVKSIV